MSKRGCVKWILGAAAALVVVIVVYMTAGVLWIVFAPYVLELGRIHRSTAIGDPADDVWRRVEDYCRRHAGEDVHCGRGRYTAVESVHWPCADGRRPSGYIHAYHWIWMDDVQLYVHLDEHDRVCGTVFWAD